MSGKCVAQNCAGCRDDSARTLALHRNYLLQSQPPERSRVRRPRYVGRGPGSVHNGGGPNGETFTENRKELQSVSRMTISRLLASEVAAA
jgi:hypothetical protein